MTPQPWGAVRGSLILAAVVLAGHGHGVVAADKEPDPSGAGAPRAQPDAPQRQRARPGREDAPVTIMAFGNRLIITSEDPQALALVNELVRLYTQTTAGEGDFEVIRLRNANAAEAARILDEAFNGTRQQQGAQQGGGSPFGSGRSGGGFGGGFGGGPAAPAPAGGATPGRIRVVADTASNALLVRASPLDMLSIRRLLDTAIDSGETDSRAVPRTWIIPLKTAVALEVATVIRDVYKEHMNAGTTAAGGGFGFPGGSSGRGGPQGPGAAGQARRAGLSLGVDDRSNRLVLSCSEALYEDVKTLVEQLDGASKDKSRTVRVVPIKGVDPALVQQAIMAVQGRPVQQTSGTRPGGTSGPGRDSGPGGTGGMGGTFTPLGFVPGEGGLGGGFGGDPGSRGGSRGGRTRGGR